MANKPKKLLKDYRSGKTGLAYTLKSTGRRQAWAVKSAKGKAHPLRDKK